jgi:hypothetical protein
VTKKNKDNFPATGSSSGRTVVTVLKKGPGKENSFLAKIRSGNVADRIFAAPVAPKVGSREALLAAALDRTARPPRLIFSIDATASREAAWSTARTVTDSLFDALPGELDVALAVHGNSNLHTFTGFTSDPRSLRDAAASIRCQAGRTCLLEVLKKAREAADVKVMIYIGDAFEESLADGIHLADDLRLRGTRLIVLHDVHDGDNPTSAEAFEKLARRTGGCVMPFDGNSPNRLRELLAALAMLAIGGVKLLEAKRKALPAAALLLEHLSGSEKERR